MLNKYGKRTQPCRTSFLTHHYYNSVPATLTLASCFLYSLASKSIKCREYHMSIIVAKNLSWEIESNAFLKSTKHIEWLVALACLYSILRIVIWSLVPFLVGIPPVCQLRLLFLFRWVDARMSKYARLLSFAPLSSYYCYYYYYYYYYPR